MSDGTARRIAVGISSGFPLPARALFRAPNGDTPRQTQSQGAQIQSLSISLVPPGQFSRDSRTAWSRWASTSFWYSDILSTFTEATMIRSLVRNVIAYARQ